MPQKKIIKGTVAKLQGTDVFHLEPAERKYRGGWVGRDGGKRKKSQDRQERRSGVDREADERSGEDQRQGKRIKELRESERGPLTLRRQQVLCLLG